MDVRGFIDEHLVAVPELDVYFVLAVVSQDEAMQIREWVRSKVGISTLKLRDKRFRVEAYRERAASLGRVSVEVEFKPVY